MRTENLADGTVPLWNGECPQSLVHLRCVVVWGQWHSLALASDWQSSLALVKLAGFEIFFQRQDQLVRDTRLGGNNVHGMGWQTSEAKAFLSSFQLHQCVASQNKKTQMVRL